MGCIVRAAGRLGQSSYGVRRMAKPLSRHERYLFSLTGSTATRPASQRAAIDREGLTGKTRAEIHKIRQANWREAKAKNPTVPPFVLAARLAFGRWDRQPPSPSMEGIVCRCRALSVLAHDGTDWGRSRKHGRGEATAEGYRVREEDNGKIGWDRVVDRYADYGCVKSPDEKKVAVQVDHSPWEVKAMFLRRFFFRGVVYRLDTIQDQQGLSPKENLRAVCKLLQRHGWDAYLTYQSEEEVSQGSGEKHRKGDKLVCVVNFGQYGYYHIGMVNTISPRYMGVIETVANALQKRREAKRQTELDAAIAAGREVYVGIGDSLNAGNCEAGTTGFVGQFCQSLGIDPDRIGGVLSSALLAFRDDQFTRRAVYAAMMRRGK